MYRAGAALRLPVEWRRLAGGWIVPGLPPGAMTWRSGMPGCHILISGQMIRAGEVLVIDAGPDRTAKVGDVIDLTVQSSSALAQVQWTATDPFVLQQLPSDRPGPDDNPPQTAVVNGVQ